MAIERSKKQLREDLESEVKLVSDSIIVDLQGRRAIAAQKRQDEIVRLKEALTIAEATGIENAGLPLGKNQQEVANYVDRNQLYLRGTKALQAQIQALEARENDDAFIDGVRELETRLSFLNAVQIDASKASVAQIDDLAQVPDRSIKPNKKLIVAIGVILGGMLGVLVALVRSAVRKRQAALQTRV